ncbi:MAG: DoxX family protein [Gammaproteobacteria bacterium]|nr:DoxX family protein [Gammaproteobacteria bacterium]MDH3810498.1 DoxX family protein [Gammaproteobacteria bacterium]
MKAVSIGILAILTLLAVSSGITKILLMPQDVLFFGKYGFSDPLLIAYGSVQLLGGFLLVFTKTRFAGAAIVAVTFLISLALLLMEGNVPVSIVTAVATLLLVVVMKRSWQRAAE